MTEVLTDFIRALRAADLRISTSETIDAGQVLNLIGYDDRLLLRNGLAQALAKTDEEKQAFGETFDRFFAFRQIEKPPEANDDAENDDQSEDGDQQGQGSQNQGGPPGGEGPSGEGQGGGSGQAQGGSGGEQPNLVELLESGDQVRLQMALAEAARVEQLNQIRSFMQRGLFAYRIMQRMGLAELDRVIHEDGQSGDAGGQARGQRLEKAREALRLQVRDYVEKQMLLFTANQGRRLREDVLSQIRLTNLDQSDLRIMRELVRKMAKKLVALHSRRRKVDRRGILDVRKTIRANIEFDGLMFHTKWKQKRIDRPKVMVVCDVSNSVAPVARFLLMFLYSVQEVLPKVRSFAFSNALGEITQLFDTHGMDEALAEAIKQHGGGGTDYGQAFVDFADLALDDIDHHTTVLIMGDARSNYTDPRADVLKLIHQRARRVLFLNPERKSSWDSGDSVMRTLSPYCDRAISCASLKDLRRVVSDLMRSSG
jgi:uncharacterized protein